MSSTRHPVTFEKYRKNVRDLWAPSGVLLAYGYIREFRVPDEISFVCAQFLDLYLGYKSTLIKQMDRQKMLVIFQATQWNSMSPLHKRLLRDQLVFRSEKGVTQIHCEAKTKQFGPYGAQWIAPIIKNSLYLRNINLSNCYLDDVAVKMICISIRESRNSYKMILDISDNYQVTDNCMRDVLSVMDQLMGLNLNCTQITDKTCVMLSDYFNERHVLDDFYLLKLDGNKGISENGKAWLRPLESRIQSLIMDTPTI
eukprot:592325_1